MRAIHDFLLRKLVFEIFKREMLEYVKQIQIFLKYLSISDGFNPHKYNDICI